MLRYILLLISTGLMSKSFYKVNLEDLKLNEKEKYVIVNKGTERAFTGKYWNHFQKGTYHCKACGAKLYNSSSKFESHCGWPSFDDEVKGAVKRIPDADGRRTEIVCAQCGGHLGHVFLGEGFTAKNTRHCVNSVSLQFKPEKSVNNSEFKTAIFASGCFWGTEYFLQKQKGVIETTVGYTGGTLNNPSYRQVSSKTTGHYEAVKVVYDPQQVSYEQLVRLFFETHDPEQKNGQGPDIGPQYRSAIFVQDENERKIANRLIHVLESKGYDIATKVIDATRFWKAEAYHQDYYKNNEKKPYCHGYKKKF